MKETGILCDASSLIYLAKADALRGAAGLFGALLAPPSVWRETVDAGEGWGQLDKAKISIGLAAEQAGVSHYQIMEEADRLQEGGGRGDREHELPSREWSGVRECADLPADRAVRREGCREGH
jgi:hypothetical protein